jgi:probable F420-dependent oxidoreductase
MTLRPSTAPAQTFGVHAAYPRVSFRDHIGLLRAIDELGYTAMWSNEIDRWDAFALPNLAANVTRLPLLGTAIATVLTRGPALLAMQAAAVAEAAEGRFVLGIGPGSPVTVGDWNGLPFDRPAGRVRDTVGAVRQLLAGERVTDEAAGVRRFRLEPGPGVEVPILMSASRAAVVRTARRIADGVLLSWVSPDDVRGLRAAADAASLPGGARPFSIMASILVYITDDDATAIAQLKQQMIRSISVPTYRKAQIELGRGDRLAAAYEAWDRRERDLAGDFIPDSVIRDLTVVGTAAVCAERLREYRAAGVDHIAVATAGHDGSASAIAGLLGDLMQAWRASGPA